MQIEIRVDGYIYKTKSEQGKSVKDSVDMFYQAFRCDDVTAGLFMLEDNSILVLSKEMVNRSAIIFHNNLPSSVKE